MSTAAAKAITTTANTALAIESHYAYDVLHTREKKSRELNQKGKSEAKKSEENLKAIDREALKQFQLDGFARAA